MRFLMLLVISLCLLANSVQAATLYAICKMEKGNPVWWSEVGKTAYLSSVLTTALPNNSYGLYIITGTAAQLTAIAGLSDVLPIGTKADKDAQVPATTRNKVNIWLSINDYTKQFPANTTGLDMVKAIYKELQGQKWEQEGAPDPDDMSEK